MAFFGDVPDVDMENFITQTKVLTASEKEKEYFQELIKKRKTDEITQLRVELKKEKNRNDQIMKLLQQKQPTVSMANGVKTLRRDYEGLLWVKEKLAKYMEDNEHMKRKQEFTTYPLKQQQLILWEKFIKEFEENFSVHMPAIRYLIEKDHKPTEGGEPQKNIYKKKSKPKTKSRSKKAQGDVYTEIRSFPVITAQKEDQGGGSSTPSSPTDTLEH